MTSKPILKAQRLSYKIKETYLWQGLSFTLSAAQLLWVQGANGSGKTTLLKVLAGLQIPSSGKVTCSQKTLSYLGDTLGLTLDLTPQQSLNFWQALYPTSSFISPKWLLEMPLHAFVKNLSAGQKQQLALACHMIHGALWIFDEPTTHLDKKSQRYFYKILSNYVMQGGAAIIVDHNLKHFSFMPTSIQKISL